MPMTQMSLLDASSKLIADVSQEFSKGASVMLQFAAGDWYNFKQAVLLAQGTPAGIKADATAYAESAADAQAQAQAAEHQAIEAEAVATAARSRANAKAKAAEKAKADAEAAYVSVPTYARGTPDDRTKKQIAADDRAQAVQDRADARNA
jgi:hypothetical protein